MTDAASDELIRRAEALGVPCRRANGPVADAAAHLVLRAATDPVVADLSAFAPDERQRLSTVLTQYADDLTQRALDATAIDGFSGQLSQAYEEVNLVYRMAKLLTSSADERAVVQSMCDELRDTLHYDWLAVRFDDTPAVLAPLRGLLLRSGTIPFEEKHLRDHAHADRVLTTAASPLAAAAGSEVLAEPVLQGNAAIGLLIAGGRQGDDPDVSSPELQLVAAAAGYLGLFHQNAFRFAEQRQQFLGTLHALSAAVDAKDPYTHGHSERVGLLASQLAARMGWSAADVDAVRVAGLLHDIGKIGVPEAVLRKPSRLTDEEFALIKEHPETGHRILADLPSLAFHLPGVLYHHERWDGRGYPHKLAGEQIPMIARFLAFADTFDAMSSSRAYRKGMERDRVIAEIRKSSGTQFDPALVEAFVTLDFTEFDNMLAVQDAQQPAIPVAA